MTNINNITYEMEGKGNDTRYKEQPKQNERGNCVEMEEGQ